MSNEFFNSQHSLLTLKIFSTQKRRHMGSSSSNSSALFCSQNGFQNEVIIGANERHAMSDDNDKHSNIYVTSEWMWKQDWQVGSASYIFVLLCVSVRCSQSTCQNEVIIGATAPHAWQLMYHIHVHFICYVNDYWNNTHLSNLPHIFWYFYVFLCAVVKMVFKSK